MIKTLKPKEKRLKKQARWVWQRLHIYIDTEFLMFKMPAC
jgi:hypothetical protein